MSQYQSPLLTLKRESIWETGKDTQNENMETSVKIFRLGIWSMGTWRGSSKYYLVLLICLIRITSSNS